MSHRIDQVNELIRQEISPIIAGIKDKYILMFTVTAVETTSDLGRAVIWLTALTHEDISDKQILAIIKNHSRDIYEQLSRRVILKKTPHLVFRIDHSIEHIQRVDQIFDLIEKGENLPLVDNE